MVPRRRPRRGGYDGSLPPRQDRVLVASGFAKWGLTNAVAAAQTLAGRIVGKPPEWSRVYNTWHPRELTGAWSALRTNSAVALYLSTGWLGFAPRDAVREDAVPAEGQGRIERHGLRPTAVCTVNGRTCQVSAVCPHLGGILRWNDAEKSWDCPLHGSRFTHDGRVIEGPATRPLADSGND